MIEFSVSQVQAETLSKIVREQGGRMPFAQSDLSIYEIEKQLLVIGPAQQKGRQRIKRVTVITSEVIADKAWFKPFIEHEEQRKRLHREDSKRRRALANTLDNAGELFLHSADWEL